MRHVIAIWIATLALTLVAYRQAPSTIPHAKQETLSSFLGAPHKSVEGNDFEIISIPATKKETYRFYIQGGLHGNELAAPKFVSWLAKRMRQGDSPLLKLSAQGVTFDLVPTANPDGVERQDRYNANGVNLNRNFSVLWGTTRENPGTQAFSEPETRAIKALFENRKYDAAVDIHGYINWIVAPSEPSIIKDMTGDKYPDRAADYTKWYGAAKDEMSLLRNYEMHTAGGLGDGGAFEDWAFWQQGVLSLCVELQNDKRFSKSYRKNFADLSEDGNVKVDNFKRYEAYIYRILDHAMKIKPPRPDREIASTNP